MKLTTNSTRLDRECRGWAELRLAHFVALALSVGALELNIETAAWAQQGRFVGLTHQLGEGVNTSRPESAPTFSPGGDVLVFGSQDRPDSEGGWDIYMASRTGTNGAFGKVVHLGPVVNTTETEAWGQLTADGKILIFSRSRGLWVATRPEAAGDFVQACELTEINVDLSITAPRLSADGRMLLFSAFQADGNRDIWVSLRSEESNETCDGNWPLFQEPVRLEEEFPGSQVNSAYQEHAPCLAGDGLTLFLSDTFSPPQRPGGAGDADIWVSTRASIAEPFGEPVNLRDMGGASVNGGGVDLFPTVSPNWPERGAELIFVSDRSGELDLWQATWEPALASDAFLRGDCNADATIDISDATCTLNWLFLGGPAPGCLAAADMNTEDAINITDATYLLNFLFLGGPPLPPPYPDCGTSDVPSDEALGCLTPPDGCR